MQKARYIIGVLLIVLAIGLYKYEDIKAYIIKGANDKIEECYFNEKCKGVDLGWAEKHAISDNTGVDIKELDEIKVRGTVNNHDNKSNKEDKINDGEVIGFFYVDKINLVEPIYQGASPENLSKGLATVEKGETLEENNVSIAGHRAWGNGVRFNRISELEIGDSVRVKTKDEEMEYKVYTKYKVKPSEVGVLDESKGKEMTLITCESYDDLTGGFKDRLILKLKKVS